VQGWGKGAHMSQISLGLAVRSFEESSSHKSLSEIQVDVDVDVKKRA
jgi:hypothetical protein